MEGTSGGPLVQSFPPKRGESEQAAQDHAQLGFEYVQIWRLHHLSWQPVPVLGHPHSKKTCFPRSRGNLLCFSLFPSLMVPSVGTSVKSQAPFSLHPPFMSLYTLMRSPWALSSPGWTVPAFPHRRDAPVLHLHNRLATEEVFLLV